MIKNFLSLQGRIKPRAVSIGELVNMLEAARSRIVVCHKYVCPHHAVWAYDEANAALYYMHSHIGTKGAWKHLAATNPHVELLSENELFTPRITHPLLKESI